MEDNINVDFEEMMYEVVNRVHLPPDRFQRRTIVNTGMNLLVS
jgi:hypothetical protein